MQTLQKLKHFVLFKIYHLSGCKLSKYNNKSIK